MGIALLKKINEKMPYWMKRPFAKMIRRKLIRNPVFTETYELLLKADDMTREEKESLQFECLKKVLRHAYEQTEYYRAVFDKCGFDPYQMQSIEDLGRLPVLTKETVIRDLDRLTAEDLENAYAVTTGGTSGKPVKVMMEKNAIYREWAFIYHYWSKFGYDYKTSRLATFRGIDIGKKVSEINPLYNEIRLNVFAMRRDNIEKYNKKIDEFHADFIYGYPSAVYNYCRLNQEAGISVSGKYRAALLISENLYPFQEEMIRSVLGCPIAIFYGHSERAVFAEHYEKGYLFQPFYGVTEIGADGAPVVTGFINGKVPLIRYLVDDKAEKIDGGYWDITGHRDSDVVYGRHGEQIRAGILDFHGSLSGKVKEFQFYQKIPGEVTIRVADPDITDAELRELEKNLGNRFQEYFSFKAERAARIERTSRGKYKYIIQECKQPPL